MGLPLPKDLANSLTDMVLYNVASLPKDLAYSLTNMVLYNVASHRYKEGL